MAVLVPFRLARVLRRFFVRLSPSAAPALRRERALTHTKPTALPPTRRRVHRPLQAAATLENAPSDLGRPLISYVSSAGLPLSSGGSPSQRDGAALRTLSQTCRPSLGEELLSELLVQMVSKLFR